MPRTSADSRAIFRMAITEPTAIDPYRVQEVEGIGITKLVFVGLLQIDTSHRLVPAVARSWKCDTEGRIWTFHLRTDVRFSNGEQVDATSFVRGVNRALDPAAATETAYHLAGIRGFAEVISGAAGKLAGLRADDQWTLVVELSEVDFEFDKKTVQPVFSPVPSVAGPAINPAYNDQPIGNGPYLMAEPWRHHKSITLRRNPGWFGTPPASEEIHIEILGQVNSAQDEYSGFLDGRYDYARVPGELVVQARTRFQPGGGFLEYDLPGLHYLIPFCHQGPMARLAGRRAVSAAIDRDRIAEELFFNSRRPAQSLVSPWFSDVYVHGLGAPYTNFDPELARKCAADAGLTLGDQLDFAYNTGAGHDGFVLAIAEQLRTVLRLDVRLRPFTAADLVTYRTSAQAIGICRAGWAYDYPTPDNLLFPLLHSSCTAPDHEGTAHGDNEGRYVNPAFDRAVARARATADEADRAQRWREAEAIAVADMALIPLWYRTVHAVFAADRFTGLTLDFFGNPTVGRMPIHDVG
jgi:oligopeptide transport system substrate-binding protein